MANPSTNEALFIVIIIVVFIIVLGILGYCFYKAFGPSRRQRQLLKQQQQQQLQQQQYITPSQLESLPPQELVRRLYGEKGGNYDQSMFDRVFPNRQSMNRPSMTREPSFRTMDAAIAARDAEIAAAAAALPPPAYGDNRSSYLLHCDQLPMSYTGTDSKH